MNTFIAHKKRFIKGWNRLLQIHQYYVISRGYFSTWYGRLGKDTQKVEEDIQKNHSQVDLYDDFHRSNDFEASLEEERHCFSYTLKVTEPNYRNPHCT